MKKNNLENSAATTEPNTAQKFSASLKKTIRDLYQILEAIERRKAARDNGNAPRTPYDYPNVRGLR